MVIEITRGLGLDPKIYIITQAMISNIGGTATLIGDSPNVIIGSKVGLTFNQFAGYLAIAVIVSFTWMLVYCWLTHRERFHTIDTNLAKLFSISKNLKPSCRFISKIPLSRSAITP